MCCPNPRDLGLEAFLSLIHGCWVLGWFCFGHLISMPAFGCKAGWSNCNFVEPFGVGFAFIGSTLYFFILKHVANFLYKKELPGGEELTKEMKGSLENMLSSSGVRVKPNKKK